MRNVESLLITQTFSSQVSQNSRGFCKQNISRQPPAARERKGQRRNKIKILSYPHQRYHLQSLSVSYIISLLEVSLIQKYFIILFSYSTSPLTDFSSSWPKNKARNIEGRLQKMHSFYCKFIFVYVKIRGKVIFV